MDPVEPSALRVVAVDWSGAVADDGERIWVAEAAAGQLVRLDNGHARDVVLRLAAPGERAVIGLDFAFGFPAWFARERGLGRIEDVWAAAAADGEAWLAGCAPPFWGRAGRPRPADDPARAPLRRADVRPAKSIFQIGGAGAVGTGSIRGMRALHAHAAAGGGVWPFRAGWPLAVEIYPRLLTGAVRKRRWRERLALLERRFPALDAALRERAAGSEDAFDAAVSALVMDRHRAALAALRPASDPETLLEGAIWQPASTPP